MENNNRNVGVNGMTYDEYAEARKLGLNEEKKPLWIQACDIEPKEAVFLRAGIPANNLTIIAGDGGVGKSLLECNLAASISTGTTCVLDPEPRNHEEANRFEPARVLLLNSEDSFAHVISKRLTDESANMDLITTVNPDADEKILIDNLLISAIRDIQPALVILDPLQAYIPKGVAMERRNDMRHMLAPLQKCAEENNTAIVIIMHTNKRQSAWGRDRLSDSADIWDVARSVFIMGNCNDENRTRYISHEKSSYGEPILTSLCCIDSHGLYKVGTTDKRDYDFIHERDRHAGGRPPMQRDAARDFIIITLKDNGGSMESKLLESAANQNGITTWTFQKARQELVSEKIIEKTSTGYGKNYRTEYSLSQRTILDSTKPL